MRLNVFVMAALVGACMGSKPRQSFDMPPPDHYVVTVDPSVTLAQTVMLSEALDAWSEVMERPGFFILQEGTFDHRDIPPLHEVRVYGLPGYSAVTKLAGATTVWGVDDCDRPFQSRIWLDTSLPVSVLEVVMRHEVGHALGLSHSSDVNSVMYPVARPDFDNAITCQDATSLCAMWQCDPRCDVTETP